MFGSFKSTSVRLPSGIRLKSIFGPIGGWGLGSVHRLSDAKTAKDVLDQLREHKRVLVIESEVDTIAADLTRELAAARNELPGCELYLVLTEFDRQRAIMTCGPYQTESWQLFSARACSVYGEDAFNRLSSNLFTLVRLSESWLDPATQALSYEDVGSSGAVYEDFCDRLSTFEWAEVFNDLGKRTPKPKPKHRYKPFRTRKMRSLLCAAQSFDY